MQKNYAAPKLTAKGSVVEITKTMGVGVDDPIDPPNVRLAAVGSVGFNL